MELREIAAFLQVAQLKSFSKAARALGYSQAAVTIQIKQLEQELEQIRAQGYAVESGELQIGLKSVAAPVFDPDGQCEYAISAVTIARSGMAGDNFQKLQEVVIRTAEEITCELRHPSAHGR